MTEIPVVLSSNYPSSDAKLRESTAYPLPAPLELYSDLTPVFYK